VQINLGRVRTVRAIAFTILFLALVAGFVWAAATAPDTATRVIGIVLAVLAGIPLLLVVVSLPRLTRPSVLRFDDRGIAYSYDGASTVVPWTDISAVGIAFEIPVDIPSIDLSGILADKLVYDVLKVNKSRKISLEIFPILPETLDHHPVLANYRQNLRPPKDGLGTGIWRMPFPSPRLARRVARGPQKYAPQLYLGWYRRPWSGSILGRVDRVPGPAA
jgi:hypothetical protein